MKLYNRARQEVKKKKQKSKNEFSFVATQIKKQLRKIFYNLNLGKRVNEKNKQKN